MNSDDNAWESAMSRDFDARVRNLHEAPLTLDDVKGKAGSIRRRRRTAVATGVLAAAAVIVPAAVFVGLPTSDNSGPDPADNPPEVVDETGVEYLAGDVWHRADGTEVVLPSDDYFASLRWDDKLVVQRVAGEGDRSQVDVVTSDGTVVDTFVTSAGVVVNDAGTTLAWVNDDGDIVTRSADAEYVIEANGVGFLRAITGGPDCRPAADACTIYTDHLVHESDGSTGEAPGSGTFGVNDASDHGTTRTESITDDSSCGSLYRPGGSRAFSTCEHTVDDIAPGGDYVAGLPDYLDGIGPGRVSILDAEDGTEVARYDDATVIHYAWVDESHLLIDAYDYNERVWRLMLLGADGTVTEVTDPVPGNDLPDDPFTLISR